MKRSTLSKHTLTAFGLVSAAGLVIALTTPASAEERPAGEFGQSEASLPGGAQAEHAALAPAIVLDAVIRDFKPFNDMQNPHNDFERYSGTTRVGLVQETLGSDGKPALASRSGWKIVTEYRDSQGRPINPALYDPERGDSPGRLQQRSDDRIYSDASFEHWYNDTEKNHTIVVPLTLTRVPGTNRYVFDSAVDEPYRSRGGFFPVNDQGWGNHTGWDRNFHFTTEVETEFVYERDAGQVFTFTGDDDVWVFIGGKLAIDMGSLHSIREQTIDLDRLEWLEDGQTYQLKIFHAERRTNQSNFRIETTLKLRGAQLPMARHLFD